MGGGGRRWVREPPSPSGGREGKEQGWEGAAAGAWKILMISNQTLQKKRARKVTHIEIHRQLAIFSKIEC
jgi:hypothetical protein